MSYVLFLDSVSLCVLMYLNSIPLTTQARRFMSEFIDDYRNEAYKAVTGQAEKTNLTLHPEYALVYLVHVLAHHPNFPVESGEVKPEPAAYEPFYRCIFLRFFLLIKFLDAV